MSTGGYRRRSKLVTKKPEIKSYNIVATATNYYFFYSYFYGYDNDNESDSSRSKEWLLDLCFILLSIARLSQCRHYVAT